MTAVHVDFETKSTCDLKVHGVYVYAADPTTAAPLVRALIRAPGWKLAIDPP